MQYLSLDDVGRNREEAHKSCFGAGWKRPSRTGQVCHIGRGNLIVANQESRRRFRRREHGTGEVSGRFEALRVEEQRDGEV